MKKLLIIFVLGLLFCSNSFAGEMNLWKKNIKLPEDVFWGHKKGWTFTANFDRKTRLTPDYAFKIVDKSDGHPVRLGEKSIRFEVRRGDCGVTPGGYDDCTIWNKNTGMYSERHELGSEQKLTGITWHTFSLFLTEDFPIEGHRYEHISLGQFHGYPNSNPSFKWDVDRGAYEIRRRTACHLEDFLKKTGSASSGEDSFKCSLEMSGNHKETLILKKNLRGKWHDIILNIKWSRKQDGYFKQWINGKLVYHYIGNTSKPKGSINRFKFGIYRGPTNYTPKVSTHVAYYDEMRYAKKSCKKLKLNDLGYSCEKLENQTAKKIDTPEEYFARYRAIIKNKIDSSVLIKAEGGNKKGAEKKGMQICMDQSIQSSFKEACYVHYSGPKPEY